MDWETDPAGINTGGWGLRLKTEDMAKFGQLYLRKGIWNGKQILPSSWIDEATSFKIDQMPGAEQAVRDSSDWLQGYCYQFWRSRHNAYRGDGAYGQYIIVMPDQDAVVAITSETPDMQSEINLVWKYLLPGIKGKKLPDNPGANDTLKSILAGLKLSPGLKNPEPPIAAVITEKIFLAPIQQCGVDSFSLQAIYAMSFSPQKILTIHSVSVTVNGLKVKRSERGRICLGMPRAISKACPLRRQPAHTPGRMKTPLT
jgi:hypothetical protein